jgi:hypothetical protein
VRTKKSKMATKERVDIVSMLKEETSNKLELG